MERNASLVPITATGSAVEAEVDVYAWFVTLFKSCVTGSEATKNLSSLPFI